MSYRNGHNNGFYLLEHLVQGVEHLVQGVEHLVHGLEHLVHVYA
jgi:hypothetical protein